MPPRTVLFLSHANPEDDAFVIWLAAQLAIAGYSVWCDKTKLLGGENFWKDIDEGIDAFTFRFLFVSTLAANTKKGTLRELKLAFDAQQKHRIKDFVVPLKIDQFPFESMQKEVRDLNCVRFEENWATGLTQLLKLLEREGAPKPLQNGATSVSEWHRRSLDRRREILVSNEVCHSNWFQLRLPKKLNFHRYAGPNTALSKLAEKLPRPHRVLGQFLVTFADKAEVEKALGPDGLFSESIRVETDQFFQKGNEALGIAQFDAFNIVSDLVRQAWERACDARGLGSFTLASGLCARFYANDQLEKNRAYFQPPRGRRTYRQVVGRKSKRNLEGEKVQDGFWHYALSASPQLTPFPRLVLRHHVIFTDDGIKPWDSPERMHKARRSVCKQWWNPAWRDRLFAFTTQLASEQKHFVLPVSENAQMKLVAKPMNFTSPWTYLEDTDTGLDETSEIELIEEDTDGGDDEEQTP